MSSMSSMSAFSSMSSSMSTSTSTSVVRVSDFQAIDEHKNLPVDLTLLVEMVQPQELLGTTGHVVQEVVANVEATTKVAALPEKSATLLLDWSRPRQHGKVTGLLTEFASLVQLPDQISSSVVGQAAFRIKAPLVSCECNFSKVEEHADLTAMLRGARGDSKQPALGLGISTSFDTKSPRAPLSPAISTSSGFASISHSIVQVSEQSVVSQRAPPIPANAQVNYELLLSNLAETISSAQKCGPATNTAQLTQILGVMQGHLNDLKMIINRHTEQSATSDEKGHNKMNASSLQPLVGQIQHQLNEIVSLLQQREKAKQSKIVMKPTSQVHQQLSAFAEFKKDVSETQEMAQIFQEMHRKSQTESMMVTALMEPEEVSCTGTTKMESRKKNTSDKSQSESMTELMEMYTESEEKGSTEKTEMVSRKNRFSGESQTALATITALLDMFPKPKEVGSTETTDLGSRKNRTSDDTIHSHLIESAILEAANSMHSGVSTQELVNNLAETIKNSSSALSAKQLTAAKEAKSDTSEKDKIESCKGAKRVAEQKISSRRDETWEMLEERTEAAAGGGPVFTPEQWLEARKAVDEALQVLNVQQELREQQKKTSLDQPEKVDIDAALKYLEKATRIVVEQTKDTPKPPPRKKRTDSMTKTTTTTTKTTKTEAMGTEGTSIKPKTPEPIVIPITKT